MKLSQVCVVVLLLVAASVAAFGDSVQDPKIIIRGVSGTSAPTFTGCPAQGCTKVGMTFSFGVPASGKGALFFTNASGQNWTSLALIEKGVPASAVSCVQNLFLSCTTRTLSNGAVEILLSGVKGAYNPLKGILNGQSFSIRFACVDKSCWPGGLDFIAHANVAAIPEPGTVALMITGLGAIVSRRKAWKSRFNS